MSETKPKELMNNLVETTDKNIEHQAITTNNKTMSNLQTVNGRSVVVGQLPDDFLRLDNNSSGSATASNENRHQIEMDEELAASLQHHYNMANQNVQQWNSNYKAYLSITFVEAHLVKNYGIMNMSLYVRIRIGNTIYETRTSKKGGKEPKWNDVFRCYLPNGIDTISIELYDDCLFTQDELIAWATYKIPEQFLRFNNETPEHYFEEKIILSGKQGDDKEGELLLAINSKPVTAEAVRTFYTSPVLVPNQQQLLLSRAPILANPLIVHKSPIPATTLLPPTTAATPVPPQPAPIQIKDEDVCRLVDMFPKIDVEIIKSILMSERGNLERAITNLLELNTTT